jgi:hypothetical protein
MGGRGAGLEVIFGFSVVDGQMRTDCSDLEG